MNFSPPTQLKRTIGSLNIISGLSQLAQFGILYPLLALWLNAHGMPTWQIGLVSGAVWVGMLGGNLFAPLGLRRWGAIRVISASGVATAVVALLFPYLPIQQPATWIALAALLGLCVGLRWIAVESWLYSIVDNAQRGRLVGIHETVIYGAQSAGPALIAWLGVISNKGLYAGAVFGLLSALPLFMVSVPMPARDNPVLLHPLAVLAGLLRHAKSFLGIRLGVVAGLIDGMLFGMLGLYLVKRGATADQAAWMITAFGLGGLISQLPLGWWSDKHGVKSATRLSAWAGIAGAVLLVPTQAFFTWPAIVLLGVISACGLTVAVIATTEQASTGGKDMDVAIAEMSIAFTLGSAIGPIVSGALMDFFGIVFLPVLVGLCCVGLLRLAKKPALEK